MNPDGTLGFSPDLVVSSSDDLPEQAMLQLRSGTFMRSEGQVVLEARRGVPASGYTSRGIENEYLT